MDFINNMSTDESKLELEIRTQRMDRMSVTAGSGALTSDQTLTVNGGPLRWDNDESALDVAGYISKMLAREIRNNARAAGGGV